MNAQYFNYLKCFVLFFCRDYSARASFKSLVLSVGIFLMVLVIAALYVRVQIVDHMARIAVDNVRSQDSLLSSAGILCIHRVHKHSAVDVRKTH